MNPDIFKIESVTWNEELNIANRVVLKHIESGQTCELVGYHEIKKIAKKQPVTTLEGNDVYALDWHTFVKLITDLTPKIK